MVLPCKSQGSCQRLVNQESTSLCFAVHPLPQRNDERQKTAWAGPRYHWSDYWYVHLVTCSTMKVMKSWYICDTRDLKNGKKRNDEPVKAPSPPSRGTIKQALRMKCNTIMYYGAPKKQGISACHYTISYLVMPTNTCLFNFWVIVIIALPLFILQ